jgi:hypothetical protein
MPIQVSDEDVQAKALELGLVQNGETLPRHLRSRVIAAMADPGPPPAAPSTPRLAREVVIQPGGAVLVDGQPFPWLVGRQPMEITLQHDGVSTVRLTLLAGAVQIVPPEPRTESET